MIFSILRCACMLRCVWLRFLAHTDLFDRLNLKRATGCALPGVQQCSPDVHPRSGRALRLGPRLGRIQRAEGDADEGAIGLNLKGSRLQGWDHIDVLLLGGHKIRNQALRIPEKIIGSPPTGSYDSYMCLDAHKRDRGDFFQHWPWIRGYGHVPSFRGASRRRPRRREACRRLEPSTSTPGCQSPRESPGGCTDALARFFPPRVQAQYGRFGAH
jgi:hypothetical protein